MQNCVGDDDDDSGLLNEAMEDGWLKDDPLLTRAYLKKWASSSILNCCFTFIVKKK